MASKKSKIGEIEGAMETILAKVVAKQPQGRFRAGLQFTTEPREVEITAEQLKMIEADPVLTVMSTISPAEAPAA